MPAITQPLFYLKLLNAYRLGLAIGVVSKKEVTDWADQIIIIETEPDYFFIELSLAGDQNTMIAFIDNLIGIQTNDALTIRVLFGALSRKLSDGSIDATQAVQILDDLNYNDLLSVYEFSKIYEFTDDYWLITPQDSLVEITDVIDFLNFYHEFNFNNWRNWESINENVVNRLEIIETEYLTERQKWADSYKAELFEINRGAKRKRAIKTMRLGFYLALPFLVIMVLVIRFSNYILRDDLLFPVIGFSTIVLFRSTTFFIKKLDEIE